ncbi:syntaxin-12 [Phlebotomus argentipes]|uniref:syntaxin-12 n=1 Tax=Phlebotomus argentipes TaxID=94469 RepID=UPI002892D8A3|nr:syntaxin-12 [Phlebotomus argentipes]
MSRGFNNNYGATSSTAVPDVVSFSPTEFISLCENVAHNIGSVKSGWQALEKSSKIIGTQRDNQQARDKVHQVQMSTNQKITATSKDLQRLAAIVRGGDKQQKLQVEKLTSDFKIVVEKYSSSQQAIATRMKASLLLNASQHDDLEASAQETQQLMQAQRTQQQQLQLEQDLVLERESRMRQIEADVLDVNQIMRDLNVMVSQQGETIDTIESSIENTRGNIEEGASELMKAAENQAKYRKKVLILLIIAVIIGLIVTGIIVARLKS